MFPMKKISLLLACVIVQNLWSQKQPNAIKITYERISNGTKLTQEPILVYADINQTLLTNAAIIAKKIFIPFYRKTNEISAYTHLENRFGLWARTYAVSCFLLTQLARMGSIFFGIALSLQAFALKGLAQVYTLEGDYQLAIQRTSSIAIMALLNAIKYNDKLSTTARQHYLNALLNVLDKCKTRNS